MARMRGLGRGLDALLGAEQASTTAEALRSLPLDALQSGKYQPRMSIEDAALGDLAESIKAQGVMQPILVRPIDEGRFEIIAGERRWRAARLAGLTVVPAIVRDVTDREALAVSLIENIQREDLNPIEEAAGVRRLTEEFGMTHAQAAEALGRSRSGVTNLLRLLELAPPVRDLLAQGRIDMGHARALLGLPVARQLDLAREAAQRQLSVREVERKVREHGRRPQGQARVDRDVARLAEDTSNRVGTTVQIKRGPKQSGRLIIRFQNFEHLESLIEKLSRR